MGFLLFIVAFGLSILLYPFAFIYSLYKDFIKAKFKVGLKNLDKHFLDMASSIDANGNVVCDDLFNKIFITFVGYQFGNRKETISSVLGKNEQNKTLTWLGLLLVKLLNLIQKNHCKNSIDNEI